MYQNTTVRARTLTPPALTVKAIDKSNTTLKTEADMTDPARDRAKSPASSPLSKTPSDNPWLAWASAQAPDAPTPVRLNSPHVMSDASLPHPLQPQYRSASDPQQSRYTTKMDHSSAQQQRHSSSNQQNNNTGYKPVRRSYPSPNTADRHRQHPKDPLSPNQIVSWNDLSEQLKDTKENNHRLFEEQGFSSPAEQQQSYLKYSVAKEKEKSYNRLEELAVDGRRLVKDAVELSAIITTHHSKKDTAHFEPKPDELEMIFADPPICFCGKVAQRSYTLEYGPVLECHHFYIDPETGIDTSHSISNRHSSCNSTSGEEAEQPSSTLTKLQSKYICGFHVHESSWNKIKHDLKTTGQFINSKIEDLKSCPLYNFTFCTIFHLKNQYNIAPPMELPKCFCRRPVALKYSHRKHHHGNRLNCEDRDCPLYFHIRFACKNGEVDGAKKCAWIMDASDVPFSRPSHRLHRLVDQETYNQAKLKVRGELLRDSKDGFRDADLEEALLEEQKEKHLVNLISALNTHQYQDPPAQEEPEEVPSYAFQQYTHNDVNKQTVSSPPLTSSPATPYTTPPQTPSSSTTTNVSTPNLTTLLEAPPKKIPSTVFVPTKVLAARQTEQKKSQQQQQGSHQPQPVLSCSSSTSSYSSITNYSVRTAVSPSLSPTAPQPSILTTSNTSTISPAPAPPPPSENYPFTSPLVSYHQYLNTLTKGQIEQEIEAAMTAIHSKEANIKRAMEEAQTGFYRALNEKIEERFLKRNCQQRTSELELEVVHLYNEIEILRHEVHVFRETERERQERLEEETSNNKCRVCFTRNIEYCLVPCGHYAYCERCVYKLIECAICRRSIQQVQKIFPQ